MDLALNNLQGLICHKTQTTNQTKAESVISFKYSFMNIISRKAKKV